MANVLVSQSMNLPIPVVGTDTGPDWATNLNACLSIIDIHNHAAGSGVQITPAGIDISTDLPINNNNLTLIRSSRFYIQPSVLTGANDVACTYVVNNDLYYNDASGSQIQITQAGGVAGSPGSIANLTSPASATYVSSTQTFVWQSAASTPANLDAGFLILRNNSASSNGLTLVPPSAMGANYTLTLPQLPTATKIVQIDNSGNFSAGLGVDNSTIEIASNNLQVKDQGIVTAKIADGAVTLAKMNAVNKAASSSCGSFTVHGITLTAVTNLSVTVSVSGRPVWIGLIPDGVFGSTASFGMTATATDHSAILAFFRGSTQIGANIVDFQGPSSAFYTMSFPANFHTIDQPSAGTYTYTVEIAGGSSSTDAFLNGVKLYAYEL